MTSRISVLLALCAALALTAGASKAGIVEASMSRAEAAPRKSSAVRAPLQRSVNDGLPPRWFGVVQWSNTFNDGHATGSVEAFAKATFTLTEVVRRFALETRYIYRPRGTLRASYEYGGGNCGWKASGTVPLTPSHGGIEILVNRVGKLHVEYISYYDYDDPTIPGKITCEGRTRSYRQDIAWLLVPPRKTTTRAGALRGSLNAGSGSVRKWCFARKEKDLEACKSEELNAVASVSGSRERAATRTLDGAKSTGDIESYTWTFSPAQCSSSKRGACAGSCKAVGPKPEAKKTGERATIKPLCTIMATLTVTDGRDEDSDSVRVPVKPRESGWKTPSPTYRETRARMKLPWVKCDTGRCLLDLLGGENIADPVKCPGQPQPGSQILCPLLNGAATWNGTGYKRATITDPDGPFDGFSYVASSTLRVNLLGVLNEYLFPEAVTEIDGHNFYSYNTAKRANVDGFLKALAQHEGWGAPGKPRTGHAQVVRDDLAKRENDPRREIEQLFAATGPALQQKADERLKELDDLLNSDTCDKGPRCRPLNKIGKFELYFFHPTGTSYSWDKTTITVT